MDFNVIQECDFYLKCKNSLTLAGEARQQCYLCRLAPGNEDLNHDKYKPIQHGLQHPKLLKEKNEKKSAANRERIAKRQSRDKSKMKISWKARNAEKATEDNIIKSTKNSGRSNRDGDHQAGNFIGLDTKLQSTNIEPIIRLAELDKAIADAKRGGMLIGGLVIRNKMGAGFVTFREEDFGEILSRLM